MRGGDLFIRFQLKTCKNQFFNKLNNLFLINRNYSEYSELSSTSSYSSSLSSLSSGSLGVSTYSSVVGPTEITSAIFCEIGFPEKSKVKTQEETQLSCQLTNYSDAILSHQHAIKLSMQIFGFVVFHISVQTEVHISSAKMDITKIRT